MERPKKKRNLLIAGGLLLCTTMASLIRLDIPAAEIEKRWSQPDSRFVRVRGIRVHYLDRGRGPTLVLLHGVSSSLRAWDDWAKILEKDHRVIRPDLPGHGLTGPLPGFSYGVDEYAKFLDDFTNALGLKKFSVGGNSLGGGIAWKFAVLRPDKVEKLILIGSIGYPVNPGLINRLAGSSLVGYPMRWITPRFAVKTAMRLVYSNSALITDAKVDRYLELLLREGNREAVRLRLARQYEDPRSADIKKINRPTLLLWGAEDAAAPIAHGKRFKADIRNSRLIIYPKAGHVVMEEIPTRTARDAARFLGGR